MSTDRGFDSLLRSWLDESAQSGQPETLLETVLNTTGRSQPRPRWLVRLGGDPMPERGHAGLSRFAPLAVAGTALLVAVLVGVALLLRPARDVGPSPLPAPSHDATPGPTATPEPTAPTAEWSATGSMLEARQSHTATLLDDGRVLVADGNDTVGEVSAELYDPISGSWTATGTMIRVSAGHTATLLRDGMVLVAGGNSLNRRHSAELYDPASGTWKVTGRLVHPAGPGHTATLLADGRVLVAGGGSADLYDPVSGTWTGTGDMVEERYYHAATLLGDGRVLAAGGSCCSQDHSVASAEVYDPDSGTWTVTGSMSEARAYTTATRLGDGTVLVAGGGVDIDVRIEPLSSAELYDPVSGTWGATGKLNAPRGRLASFTLLRDGTVLAVGGQPAPSGPLASAELYEPRSQTWTATANMEVARLGHTATLLPDGTVLVAGGFNDTDRSGNYISMASAQLYDPGSGT
jgi:N-acetylneuraminic acid mutarotase